MYTDPKARRKMMKQNYEALMRIADTLIRRGETEEGKHYREIANKLYERMES